MGSFGAILGDCAAAQADYERWGGIVRGSSQAVRSLRERKQVFEVVKVREGVEKYFVWKCAESRGHRVSYEVPRERSRCW